MFWVNWLSEQQWWDSRLEDLATWTQDQRDDLRLWAEWAYGIQIVVLESGPAFEPSLV